METQVQGGWPLPKATAQVTCLGPLPRSPVCCTCPGTPSVAPGPCPGHVSGPLPAPRPCGPASCLPAGLRGRLHSPIWGPRGGPDLGPCPAASHQVLAVRRELAELVGELEHLGEVHSTVPNAPRPRCRALRARLNRQPAPGSDGESGSAPQPIRARAPPWHCGACSSLSGHCPAS